MSPAASTITLGWITEYQFRHTSFGLPLVSGAIDYLEQNLEMRLTNESPCLLCMALKGEFLLNQHPYGL